MDIRTFLVKCLDSFWREPILNLKTRHLSTTMKDDNSYIFMVDGRIPHGGMFDRLKGAITIYAIAKAQHKKFHIDWTYPFDLRKYLEPNGYDWRIEEKDMQWGFFNHKAVIAYGEINNPTRLWKKRKKETHFYYGYNSLDKVNVHFNKNFDWGNLYRELFRPTSYLQNYIDQYQKEIGSNYIAIHTRFLNLLGDKNETDVNPTLPIYKREQLMISACKKIKDIYSYAKGEDSNIRIMIASDSMTFIKFIKQEIPSVYIVPGTVKHIDTAQEVNDSENIKLFTDYYLIANARYVYSLWHEGMWRSAFPEYAAIIGSIPFTRIDF